MKKFFFLWSVHSQFENIFLYLWWVFLVLIILVSARWLASNLCIGTQVGMRSFIVQHNCQTSVNILLDFKLKFHIMPYWLFLELVYWKNSTRKELRNIEEFSKNFFCFFVVNIAFWVRSFIHNIMKTFAVSTNIWWNAYFFWISFSIWSGI